MRTDSTNLSKDALENIKDYILDKYGKNITYVKSINLNQKIHKRLMKHVVQQMFSKKKHQEVMMKRNYIH